MSVLYMFKLGFMPINLGCILCNEMGRVLTHCKGFVFDALGGVCYLRNA